MPLMNGPGAKVTGPNLRGAWINLPADPNSPDPVIAFLNAPARPQSFDTSGGCFQVYWTILMFLSVTRTHSRHMLRSIDVCMAFSSRMMYRVYLLLLFLCSMAILTIVMVPIGAVLYLLFVPFALACPSCWPCVWICEELALMPCIIFKEMLNPEPDQMFNQQKGGPSSASPDIGTGSISNATKSNGPK